MESDAYFTHRMLKNPDIIFWLFFFNVIVFVFSTEFQEANLFWRNSVPKAHIQNWMYTHTSARLCKHWIIYTINSEFKIFKNSAFMEGFLLDNAPNYLLSWVRYLEEKSLNVYLNYIIFLTLIFQTSHTFGFETRKCDFGCSVELCAINRFWLCSIHSDSLQWHSNQLWKHSK